MIDSIILSTNSEDQMIESLNIMLVKSPTICSIYELDKRCKKTIVFFNKDEYIIGVN